MKLAAGHAQQESLKRQAEFTGQMSEYNASVLEAEGVQAANRSIAVARQFTRKSKRHHSAQVAKAGTSSDGSTLLVLLENARNAKLDQMAILDAGRDESDRRFEQARIGRITGEFKKDSLKHQGKLAMITGVIGTVADVGKAVAAVASGGMSLGATGVPGGDAGGAVGGFDGLGSTGNIA